MQRLKTKEEELVFQQEKKEYQEYVSYDLSPLSSPRKGEGVTMLFILKQFIF
jgi:hypothetical protein